MKIMIENKFNITKEQINVPFIANNVPIGVVTDVDNDLVTVLIWDKFFGIEKGCEAGKNIFDSNTKSFVTAICVGNELSDNAKINMFEID